MFTNTSCPYSDGRDPFRKCQYCTNTFCGNICKKYSSYTLSNTNYIQSIDDYTNNKEYWLGELKRPPIGCWDTSNMTTLSKAFYGIHSFNEDITCWNTVRVISMDEM